MNRERWTILLVLALAGCATPAVRQPETPRIHCVNYGQVAGTVWWLYACTFTGPDSVPVAPPTDDLPTALGDS